ncbi:RNA polymerase sigma factor [Microbacterium sp.]|uniref:RNA polymerase sigma factor n=1 Tax=Microbacterium sp. TaxID=51671 RepID=UPI003F6ED19E
MSDPDPDEALEAAHRAFFGRLVGWLFRRTGDLQLAEDAVSASFASAVTAWRAGGVPASPEAWLRVASRNQAMSALRSSARVVSVAPEDLEDRGAPAPSPDAAIDDRLGLLMVCAHPAIDPRMHAPLMLQAVLGVDAARIASVYLIPAATMGQRLSRSKAKIRDAGLRFEVPEPESFAPRLDAVLQAVYGAYGLADPIADVEDERDAALRAEAIRLAEVLAELLPAEPEVWGLLSLMLHTESRRGGRIVDGEFVPLAAQDTSRWSRSIREAADAHLRRAASMGRIGRFQLEAAISALHSSRADDREPDASAIVALYRGLLRIAPSPGATIGAAAALLSTGETVEARTLLDSLPAETVRSHQPYWVCRARIALADADGSAACAAAERAIGLTSNPAVRRYLIRSLLRS